MQIVLSSSISSKSGGFGNPSNMNSYIHISSSFTVVIGSVSFDFLVFFLGLDIGSPNSGSDALVFALVPLLLEGLI